MIKKILLLLLVLLPIAKNEAEAVTVNGIDYLFNKKTNTAEVQAYNYSGDIVIPETVVYNNVTYTVTSIGIGAFYNATGLTSVSIPNTVTAIKSANSCGTFFGCTSLTSIIIPSSVTTIGDYAFGKCTGLTSIVIPNSVTSIEGSSLGGTFSGCTGLTSVIIGNSVESIGERAFYGCRNLTEIIIPNSVTSIGASSFSGCSGLTNLVLGNAVTSIGAYAFCGCQSLETVTIPDSVTTIGNEAFSSCSNLTSVIIGKSITTINYAFGDCNNITSVEFHCKEIGSWFSEKASLSNVVIGDEVESIGERAFNNCQNLTTISISNSVTSIGDNAFEGCVGFDSFVLPNNVTSIGRYAFYDCSNLASIVIPNSTTSLGSYAFYRCTGLELVTIGNSVSSIDEYTFYGCNSLSSITIGSSVSGIGKGAFLNCSEMASISLPNSVTSIGESAFYKCSNLSSVTMSNSLTSLGKGAFENCNSLTSITIPDPVTCIEENTFSGCSSLASVSIGNQVTSIGTKAFYSCESLTSINLPNTVTSIGTYAFYGSGLTSVIIPNGITTIETGTFDHCKDLDYVSIGNSVESIGQDAFNGCKSLTSVNIPISVVSIGFRAFDECSNLFSIVIPNSVSSIGGSAFADCSSLTSVSIGNNVTSIETNVFAGCQSLTSVVFGNSLETIGRDAFNGCKNLASVTLPSSIKNIEYEAFLYCLGLKDFYCLAEDVPNTHASVFWKTYVNQLASQMTVHVPAGCIDKYRSVAPWSNFQNWAEIEGDVVASVELKLTAEEKDGLVTLRSNSVPGDLGYRITRTDANGVNAYFDGKGNYYPDNVEYVDNPPAAGTYTYSLEMDYLDATGVRQKARANEVTVTVDEAQPEEEIAQEYGFITGRIECDKNPPVGGLKIKFSDDVTVNARGTIFTRQRIPAGKTLTMTVSGDNTHSYEPATVQVKAGLNTVAIQGTWREEYQPVESDYDLAYCYDLNIVAIGGELHARFTVKNMGDYPWEGDVYIEAKKHESLFSEWFLDKPVYTGKAHIDEVPTGKYGAHAYVELDVVIEGLVLKEDTKFKFNFKSNGRWKRDGINDKIMEKPLTFLDNDPSVQFPIEKMVPSNSQRNKRWDKRTIEEFSCLMLGLSSITPGMEGIIGDFSNYQYRNKMVAFAKEFTGKNDETQAIRTLFNWLSEVIEEKTVLELLNEITPLNGASLTFDVVMDLKNIILPEKSIFQKLKKDFIVKASDIKEAKNMLGNIASVAQAITCYDKFECIMHCASALYGLCGDVYTPLGSIMYTYMTAGRTLINAAKQLQAIVHDSELPDRLLANRSRNKPKDGVHEDHVKSYNTTCDFKVIVQTDGFWGSTVNFKKEKYRRQVKDIVVKASNTDFTTTFLFDLQYQDDGIMLKLKDTNYVILPSGIQPVIGEGQGGGANLTKFYLEIQWSNDHVTVIPLNVSSNGLDIKCGDRGPIFDAEGMKTSLYTITLTTTTGKDNMADELYLGDNEDRQ